jgi:fatty acid desaturase
MTSLIRHLSERDNWLNWLFLVSDWVIIGAAVTVHLLRPGPITYLLVLAVIGSRMRALANLLHEAAHFKLFRSRRLNNLAGRMLCALPIFISYRRYVADHKLHHRNLWKNSQDPDLALYELTGTVEAVSGHSSFTKFLVKHVVLVVVPVMPWWRLLREAMRDRVKLVMVCLLLIIGAILWSTGPAVVTDIVVFCWIIPWFTSFQIISYWAELGEHGGLKNYGWSWGSRNWRGNVLTRWVIGSHSDDIYHLLHHWFPSVPHYRLRSLDRVCRSRWSEYSSHARCDGFFVGSRSRTSVLRDIWHGGE